MADMNLDTLHPEYLATRESRTISRDLYEGWRAVKAKAQTYLLKEPRESDDDYTIRLARAVLDNWVEKVVQARQAVLFRKPVKRILPAALKQYVEDVDRHGTNADAFFEEAAFDAAVDGIHWVAIDMPRAPEAGHVSMAAEKLARHRPFFEHIPGENVIDWEIGEDGELDFAVVKMSRLSRRVAPGVDQSSISRWKVWYRNHWEVYEATKDDEGEVSIALVDEGVNTSGVVALVPFFGIKETEQSGWPVVEKLLPHIVLIYNKRSDLDRSERIAAHPTPYVISPEKLEVMNMTNGIWICSKDAAGLQIEVGILETSGVAFDSIRESISGLVQTIQANALAQAKKDSAQVESAEGQKEYRKAFNSSLRSASVNFENSERRCWTIFGLWLKNKEKSVIDYNRDFDDKTIDEAMIARLSELAGGKPVITQETLLRTLQKGELIDPDLDVDKEIASLTAKDEAATEAFARSLVPVAQTMPPEPVQ